MPLETSTTLRAVQEEIVSKYSELHSKTHLPSCMFLGLPSNSDGGPMRPKRTRGQALLELVGLLGVLQDKGVKVLVAADLELGLLVLAVLLDAGG